MENYLLLRLVDLFISVVDSRCRAATVLSVCQDWAELRDALLVVRAHLA